MKKRTFEYIIPGTLALLITILLILNIPCLKNGYRLDPVHSETLVEDYYKLYADLDEDGNSEEISVFYNAAGDLAVSVSLLDRSTINQFNLRGTLLSLGDVLDTGDWNRDGITDLFICTRERDSLFLYVIDDLFGRPTTTRVLFADSLNQYNDHGDYLFAPGGISDLDGDGRGEYLFSVNGGHALQPRKTYAADLARMQISRSPVSGAAIVGLGLYDLDRDGKEEVLLNTASPENFKFPFPYRDTTTWLMVLNGSLDWFVPPVPLNGAPSWIRLEPFRHEGESYILAYQKYRGAEDRYHTRIVIYDTKLRMVRSRYWPEREAAPKEVWRIPGKNSIGDIYFFNNGTAKSYGFDLQEVQRVDNGLGFNRHTGVALDILADGSPEYISLSGSKLGIFNERFELTASAEVDWDRQRPRTSITLLKRNGSGPLLSVQKGSRLNQYNYRRNWPHQYRAVVYPALFFLIFAFFTWLASFQGRIVRKRYERERLIHSLRMQVIRNQLDPHFTYNALNAVGSLIYKERKDEAYRYMKGLSDLLRMVSADPSDVSWTLAEELEFVEKYLDIEKLRFREKFHYRIRVAGKDMDQLELPKLCILTFVENAIKHGLRHKVDGRELSVTVEEAGHQLRIAVRDNGIGRAAAAKYKNGEAGYGLELMEKYFSQFNEVHPRSASFKITDLYDEDRKAAGTLAEITIY